MQPTRVLAQTPPALRQTTGRLHAIESCGTVDGPGIRTVVFLQGCRLACRFCHNPDSWNHKAGTETTVEALARQLLTYRPYHQASGGGVTLSGGDPLAQPEFSLALLQVLREIGTHTALDTSGGRPLAITAPIIDAADMVLLDIKHTDAERHQWLTGIPIDHPLATAEHCATTNKRVWIRHVIIPGITDDDEHLNRLGQLIALWPKVERVDLLPYHTMHLEKWASLGMDNPLDGVPPTDEATMRRAREILKQQNAPIADR